MTIQEFQGEYRFLSNFWFVHVIYDHLTYPSVEHAYQAAKTLDMEDRDFIRHLPKPGDAKRAGKNVVLREDWEQIKLMVMKNLVWQKFQHPGLKSKLLATGDQDLIEGNRWHDNFWGYCSCYQCNKNLTERHNHLGMILMEVRTKLRK